MTTTTMDPFPADDSGPLYPRRSAARRSVSLTGRLREQGRTAIDVKVHDLSTHGFQVDSVYRLRPGTLVWLQVARLAPLAARVKWFRDFRVGCAFESPLHPSVFERIVASAETD